MLAILIGGLFALLFAGMMLAIFFGAQRAEEEFKERAREAQEIREQAARIPRFLVVNRPTSPRPAPPDDALLWQVQQYLEAEQTLADEFVLQPSIESLYRESGRRITTH
jgi:hypothetical protein